MYRPRRSGESRNPGWQPCVNLLASSGMAHRTSNLTRHVWQHKNGLVEGDLYEELGELDSGFRRSDRLWPPGYRCWMRPTCHL